ncbi:MAG: carboxypeptidase regulatory-like domain-containing protein, partial [Lachnospiraceae bacterium]|nr:carboxypeptidase regulatory-like domain-containing protein [Lachnospiraceae bacterium]
DPSRFDDDANMEHVDIFIPDSLMVSGTVTDSKGKALSGVTVELGGSGTEAQSKTTGQDGRFEFPNLVKGAYTITATLSGRDPVSRTFTLENTSMSGLVLVIESLFSRTVHVVDSKGIALDGAKVWTKDAEGNTIDAKDEGSGNYTFSNLEEGTYPIQVESGKNKRVKDGGSYGAYKLVSVQGKSAEPIEIQLKTLHTVTGKVVDDDEKGRSGVQVELWTADGSETGLKAVTDSNGSFSISDVSNGEYLIAAQKPSSLTTGNTEWSLSYVKVEGDDVDAGSMGVVESAILVGMVTGSDGKPIQNARVSLKATDAEKTTATLTDEEGVYYFENLNDGTYSLEASDGKGNHGEVLDLKVDKLFYQEIEVKTWHMISGQVRLDDTAGERDSVAIALYEEGKTQATRSTGISTENAYKLPRVENGTYRLQVTDDANEKAIYEVTVAGEDITRDLVLSSKKYTLTGKVTTLSGEILRNATVKITSGEDTSQETRTDGSGAYQFSSLAAGSYAVTGTYEGYSTKETVELVEAATSHNLAINVPSKDILYSVSGIVKNADGEAVEGATVHLLNKDGSKLSGKTAVTGKDGTFTIQDVVSKEYRIRAVNAAKESGEAEATVQNKDLAGVECIIEGAVSYKIQKTYEYDQGKLVMATDIAEDIPQLVPTGITTEWLESNMTSDEKKKVGAGAKLVFELQAEKLALSKEQSEAVTEALAKLGTGGKIASGMNVTFRKRMIGSGVSEVSKLPGKSLSVILPIPGSLKAGEGVTRTYSIWHITGTKAELLRKTTAMTAIFETNAFSPYVLAYHDVKKSSKKDESEKTPTKEDTGKKSSNQSYASYSGSST